MVGVYTVLSPTFRYRVIHMPHNYRICVYLDVEELAVLHKFVNI